jgi:hypothetical protein
MTEAEAGEPARQAQVLAVVGGFRDPVKAAADESELFQVKEFEQQTGFVAVHVAVKNQLVRGGPNDSEIGFPVLVHVARDGESFVADVDVGGVTREGIVDALEGDLRGAVENDTAPAARVAQERRAKLTVDKLLLHVPDAIKRGLRAGEAVLLRGVVSRVHVRTKERETKEKLRREGDPVGPDCGEKGRLNRSRRSDCGKRS